MIGDPVTLAEHVGSSYNTALRRFSASASSLLMYGAADNPDLQLTWYDRNGKMVGTVGEPGRYSVLNLSHDGTKAGVMRSNPQDGNRDVWVVDLVQGTSTRLTFDPSSEGSPVFSPDASRVAYISFNGSFSLYARATNGAGGEQTLLKPSPATALTDWSSDGRSLIFGAGTPLNI